MESVIPTAKMDTLAKMSVANALERLVSALVKATSVDQGAVIQLQNVRDLLCA